MASNLKQVASQPLDLLHPDPMQPRQDFDQEELRLLGESLKQGQWVPLLVKPDHTIIDGERRWRAAKLAGLKTLDVIITDERLTESQVREIQLVTALHRADLKPYEQYLGCKSWMEADGHATANDLATKIGRNGSTVSRILSLARCIPAVQEAAKAGLLGVSDWAEIAKVSDQEQHQLLTAKLNGASRDDLARQGRKVRNGNKPAIPAGRVVCPLPSGITITLGGNGLTLDMGVEALLYLAKEMKDAVKANISPRTFSANCKDKAKGAA